MLFLGRCRMYWGDFGEARVGDASPFRLGMLLSISFIGISWIVSYLIYIPPAMISFSYPYDHYKPTTNLLLCQMEVVVRFVEKDPTI